MKKLISISLAVVLAISLMLVPAIVQADDSVGLGVGVYSDTLVLENKDADWIPITDDIGGLLGYNAVADEFEWGLEATVLMSNTDYALIYYADMPNRFVDWGGDNPGAFIALVTSDENGVIAESGSIDLGMDLPCPPDANQFEIDYSGIPDFYDNAHGAKVWLVPASYLPAFWPNDGSWMNWSATIVDNILFETDLIWYDDTNEESAVVSISVNPTNIDFGILRPGDTGSATVTLTSGNVPIIIGTTGTLGGAFVDLTLAGTAYSSYTSSLDADSSAPVAVSFTVPTSYTPAGAESETMVFIATSQ